MTPLGRFHYLDALVLVEAGERRTPAALEALCSETAPRPLVSHTWQTARMA